MQIAPRRCFVHIGPPKTGTSYLQTIFWSSREELASQGVVLPLETARDHFHLALALRGLTRITATDSIATVLRRLTTAIADISGADLLISQEQLAPATAAEAARLVDILSGWEVHVIVTARDVGRQIPSHWQQSVRQRATLGYADFLTAVVERRPEAADYWRHQDLAVVSRQWASAVSPERVHIVTVPPAGSSPTELLERFSSVLRIDPTRLNASPTVVNSNSSLGHVQAQLLLRVNEVMGADLLQVGSPTARGQHYLAMRVLPDQHGAPPQVPAERRRWCADLSERVISELDERGYDVIGDLDDLRPRFSTTSDSTPTEAEVIDAAARALAEVVRQRHVDLERVRPLRAQLAKRAADA
jgi:hypothetical protein